MSPLTELIGGAKAYGWSTIVVPSDTYTRVADSTYAVDYHGGALEGGKYYVIGGGGGVGNTYNQQYDPVADTWSSKAALPANRNALCGAAVSGKVYAIGDYYSPTLNTEYSVSGNSWTAKATIPTGISYVQQAVAIGTNIYVVGGSPGGTLSNPAPNQVYDTTANTWSTKATLTGGRTGMPVVTDGTDIYLVAGENSSGRTNKLTKYSVSGNSYSELAVMPSTLTNGAGAYVNGKIYYFGGTKATSPYYVTEAYRYTVSTDSWVTITSLPIYMSAHSAVVIGSKIYMNAGDSGGQGPKRTYYYQT